MFHDDVWRYLPIGPVPSMVLALLGSAVLVYSALVASPRARSLAVVTLVGTVLVVLMFTGRGALGNTDGEFSWSVGQSIKSEWNSINRSVGMVNVFGNVVMFVPVGWLVAVLVRGRFAGLVGTLAGLVLSVVIEVWQMLSGSFGDVDDLLLNSVGAAAGAIVATVLMQFRRAHRLSSAATAAEVERHASAADTGVCR